MSEAPQSIVIVAGPTASGKSALGLALAEEFGGNVINADSMQLYRDLAVLTARPGAAALARVPHALYGVLDAAEACSAGRWRAMAVDAIAAARAAGRLPILTGGTGLYLRALLRGLAPVPEIPPALREAARALQARLGNAGLHQALAERDPEAAQRLAPSDMQRLIRAFEVVTATGRPLSAWQRAQDAAAPYRAAVVLLLPPRAPLYAACDARFLAMMAAGAVAEVEHLLARSLEPSLPAMKAVGVRELAGLISGSASEATAVAAGQQATRRYAKRQYTWFAHQLPEGPGLTKRVLSEQYSESLAPETFAFIRQFMLTVRD
jgi:tRNA dimethylallyltransferase